MQQNLPTHGLSEKRANFIVFTLLVLFPLAGMSIDLIAPSLPAISHSLNASSAFSKNLISLYLLGYMSGNVFAGVLSDAWGRQKLMIGGLGTFAIASLLPTFFPHPDVLSFTRFLQGFTLAFYALLVRTIISDILPTERVVRTAALIATMWGIGPIIGPMIGGYLQFYFGWQACFYFFAGFSFIGFITLLLVLPETHHNRLPLNFNRLKESFREVFSHKIFVGLSLLMGFTYSVLIVFNTLAPFLIQTTLGHSSIYFGHMALFMGVAFLSGTMVCRHALKTLQPEVILKRSVYGCLFIAIISLLLTHMANKNVALITISSFLMIFCCGIVFPACLGKGSSLFRHLAGSAAAVMNIMNISIAALMAALMSTISATSAIPLNSVYLALAIACGLSCWLLIHKKPQ